MKIFYCGSILLSVCWPCFASSGNHHAKDNTESLEQLIDFNRFLKLFSDFGVFDLQLLNEVDNSTGITLTFESVYALYVPSKSTPVLDNETVKLNYEIRVNVKASHKQLKNVVRAKFVSEENVVTFKTQLKDGVLSLKEDSVKFKLEELLYHYLVSCEPTNSISDIKNLEDLQMFELESHLFPSSINLGRSTQNVLHKHISTSIERVIMKYNGVDFDLENKEILVGTFFRNHAEQIFDKTWALSENVRQAFKISEDSLKVTALENSNDGINVTVKLHSFQNFHLSRLQLIEKNNKIYAILYLHIEAIFGVYDNISNNHIMTARIIPPAHQQNGFKYAVTNTGNKLQLQEKIGHYLSLPIWSTEKEILQKYSREEALNIHPAIFNIEIPSLNLGERCSDAFEKFVLVVKWKIPNQTDSELSLRLYQRDDLILQMTIPLEGKVWYNRRKVFVMIGSLDVTYVLEYDSKKTLNIKSASQAKIRNVSFFLMNDSGFDDEQLSEIRRSVEQSESSYNHFNTDIISRLHILFGMYNNRISKHYASLLDNKIPVLTGPVPQNLIWSFKLPNEGPEATLTDISLAGGEIDNSSNFEVQFRLNSVTLTYKIGPSSGVRLKYRDLLYRVYDKRNFFQITSIDTDGICTQPSSEEEGYIDLVEHRKRLTNVVIHYYTPLLVDALMSYIEGMLNK